MRNWFPLLMAISICILLIMRVYEYKQPVTSGGDVLPVTFTPSYGLKFFLSKDPVGAEFSRCKSLLVTVRLGKISGDVLRLYGFKREVGNYYCWNLHISSKCRGLPCRVIVLVEDGRVLVDDYISSKRGYNACLNFTAKNLTLKIISVFEAVSKVRKSGEWGEVEDVIVSIKRKYGGGESITTIGTKRCYFSTDGFVLEKSFNISINFLNPIYTERSNRKDVETHGIDDLDFMVSLAQMVEWRESAGSGKYVIVYATYYPLTGVLWVEVAEAYPVTVIKEFVFNI